MKATHKHVLLLCDIKPHTEALGVPVIVVSKKGVAVQGQ